MTWIDLLAEHRVDSHRTSKRELDDLRRAVERNLRDAAVTQLSADNRFGLAYEAALLLAKMAIACAGYRVKGQGAHHTSFLALKLAVGPSIANAAGYFDRCRRKRNELSYDAAGIVTDTEATEIVAQVRSFQNAIESWIRKQFPALG